MKLVYSRDGNALIFACSGLLQVCIICCVFLVAEILLVSPDYGTLWPVALAGVFAILLAAVRTFSMDRGLHV